MLTITVAAATPSVNVWTITFADATFSVKVTFHFRIFLVLIVLDLLLKNL